MATGTEISKIIQQKIGKAYSGYYDPVKLNRLMKSAMDSIVDQKVSVYRQTQKIADEIQPLVVYWKPMAVNNNKIVLRDPMVSNFTYVGTTVTIETEYPHNLVVGDSFLLKSNTSTGITGASGGNVSTVISPTKFTYDNIIPPTGGYVRYTFTVNSAKYLSDYNHLLNARFKFPSFKDKFYEMVGPAWLQSYAQSFGRPSARFPRCESASNILNIEPSDVACQAAEISYVKCISVYPDSENNTYDFSHVFNEKLIDHLTSVCAKYWAGWIKDEDQFKNQTFIISENP